MQSSTAYIPAGMSELALLPPCAVSEVVVLADLCTSICVSPVKGSISVGGYWGRQPTVGSVGGGSKAGGYWCSKGLAG